jgi:glycosyltransferase involved in cell wall biosynthesis
LSSRYEGFPMALLEAMAHGLAVVSFDCDSGPREIIRHEVDGLLVEPVGGRQHLALAIERLIQDEALRCRLGHGAVKVVERFSQERFVRRWEEVLQDLLHPPGSRETNRQS